MDVELFRVTRDTGHGKRRKNWQWALGIRAPRMASAQWTLKLEIPGLVDLRFGISPFVRQPVHGPKPPLKRQPRGTHSHLSYGSHCGHFVLGFLGFPWFLASCLFSVCYWVRFTKKVVIDSVFSICSQVRTFYPFVVFSDIKSPSGATSQRGPVDLLFASLSLDQVLRLLSPAVQRPVAIPS